MGWRAMNFSYIKPPNCKSGNAKESRPACGGATPSRHKPKGEQQVLAVREENFAGREVSLRLRTRLQQFQLLSGELRYFVPRGALKAGPDQRADMNQKARITCAQTKLRLARTSSQGIPCWISSLSSERAEVPSLPQWRVGSEPCVVPRHG